MDADLFHLHTSRLLDPRDSGVVIPFMIVPGGQTGQDAQDREDVVRASGFTSYTFECDWEDFTLEDHTRLALLMEDVLDDIIQIKADGEARISTYQPLWPLVEMRSTTPLP
jgi:phosphoketolase